MSEPVAAQVCPPRGDRTPDVYIFTRPPSQALDEYLAMLESRGVTYLNDYPLEALRLQLPEGTPPRYEVAPIERLVNGRFEVWIVPARSGAVVRWRERTTCRDWLCGFDDIRAAAGRIQDWADVGPHPMAEPRPVDRRYRVAERAGDTIVLEVQLDNGLRVTRRMTLDASGLLVAMELFNTSNEPIVPKFGLGAEFSDKELPRPSVWLETGRGWVRGRWNRDAWTGLRAARTVTVDTASDAAVRTRVTRAAGGETVTMVSAFTRATLAPGASRRMSVRYAIVEEPPRRLD